MLRYIIAILFFLWTMPLVTAQNFGKKEHEALLHLQRFVNEFTLHINAVALQQEKLKVIFFEEKLKKMDFSPFIASLKPRVEALVASTKNWDIQKIHTQQDELAESMYLAYLKANEHQLLENQYHHAEAEMTHALAEAQKRWHLCESKLAIQSELETPIPISQMPSLQPFWNAWKEYKDKLISHSPKERLDFYNQTLIKLFNDFIDAAGKQGEYMPYQICLVLCPQEEASAEGK